LIKNQNTIRNLAFHAHQLIEINYSFEQQIAKRAEFFEYLI
jgi:hypothetical protein